MSFCFGIAMSIQPIWVGGWSFIGSQCLCAHIHVDVDVYELRVYFICEENISDFLELAQKMGFRYFALHKIWKDLTRNWPRLRSAEGA